MTTSLKNLSEKHQRIKFFVCQGLSGAEIARRLEMHPRSVQLIISTPLFQTALKDYRLKLEGHMIDKQVEDVTADPVADRIRAEAMASVEKVVGLRDFSESEKIQQGSAFDLLNRAGYSAKETKETEHRGDVVLGDKQVLILNEALEETNSVSVNGTQVQSGA